MLLLAASAPLELPPVGALQPTSEVEILSYINRFLDRKRRIKNWFGFGPPEEKNAFQRTKSFLDLAIVSHPAKMINGPKQFPVLTHELLKSIGEERAGGGFARIGVADRASPPSSFACEVFTFTRIQPHR